MARDLGLNEAAGRAQISKAALSQWESDARIPSGEALDRLLSVLGVNSRIRARLLTEADPRFARTRLSADPLGPIVDLGELLRGMRLRSRLTQSELAKLCSVRQPSVAAWESGDSVPGPEALHMALQALQARPEEMEAIRRCRHIPSDPNAKGDLMRRLRVFLGHETPYELKEPMILLIQRDAWRDAVLNPASDEILCESIVWRGAWYDFWSRTSESLAQLHHSLRLAKACGNLDLGALALVRLLRLSCVDQPLEVFLKAYHTLLKWRNKPLSRFRRGEVLLQAARFAIDLRQLDWGMLREADELAEEAFTLLADYPSHPSNFPYTGVEDAIGMLAWIQSMWGKPEKAIELIETRTPRFKERGFFDNPSIADAYLVAILNMEDVPYPPEALEAVRKFIPILPPQLSRWWKGWERMILHEQAGGERIEIRL